MEADIQKLIEKIHNQEGRIVYVTAGAGTYALAWLLGVAGASRTVIEALVPYDWHAFDDFLGQTPARYVDAGTARLMAGRAFTRADWLIREDEPLVGVACTATIVTDRPKKGDHRAHVALWSPERVVWQRLTLDKGRRDRGGEETMVSRHILNVLAEALGMPERLDLALETGDILETGGTDIAGSVAQLMNGGMAMFHLQADGTFGNETPKPYSLLSGSFNPLHDGHLSLAQAASDMTGLPPAFEITLMNADKAALAASDALHRIAQFAGRWDIFASNAGTFAQKAILYPGSTFVVGFDTAARVLEWRFYEGSRVKMGEAMETIQAQGCRFLVAGRTDSQGKFQEAYELKVPLRYKDLFEPMPSHRFRRDISSTDLRNTGARGSR
jgi:hypothetical protein